MKVIVALGATVAAVAAATLITGIQPAMAYDPGAAPAQAQPLKNGWPGGKGLDVLLQDCSGCHSPALVKNERHNAQGWDDVIGVMVGRGAQVSDADQDTIRDYLAHNFGPASTADAK